MDDYANEPEYEINYRKDSLNPSQSNSVFIKSFDDEKFNFTEILNTKNDLIITFQNSNNAIQILTKTIKKILSLIETETTNIEYLYSQYITAVVVDENPIDKEDLLNIDEMNNNDNSTFIKLLNQTKYYLISFPKNTKNLIMEDKLLNLDTFRDKIPIQSKTLKKIFQLLQKNIYDMYDLINIIILNMNNDISVFKSKILDKYIQTNNGEIFMGIKNFDLNLEKSEKITKTDFISLDSLFNNVLSYMEDMFTKDYEKDSEEDDDNQENFNIPKISIREEIQNANNDEINDQKSLKCKCGEDVCKICSIY